MLSKNNIKWIRSLHFKKFREIYQRFIAEGTKLSLELINSAMHVEMIIATKQWLDVNKIDLLNLKVIPEIIEATIEEIGKISALHSPSPVLVVAQIPIFSDFQTEAILQKLSLYLDEIQDPGNLGTIIRMADWFGIESIFCSEKSVDLFNPKVVQATMGAICRVQIHYVNQDAFFNYLNNFPEYQTYGTFLEGENIYKSKLSPYGLIILGNEGKGISPELHPYIKRHIYIPSFPPGRNTSESLNISIAAAVVCSEFRRSG
jgi:RNA methyltransferase, TrmH family